MTHSTTRRGSRSRLKDKVPGFLQVFQGLSGALEVLADVHVVATEVEVDLVLGVQVPLPAPLLPPDHQRTVQGEQVVGYMEDGTL